MLFSPNYESESKYVLFFGSGKWNENSAPKLKNNNNNNKQKQQMPKPSFICLSPSSRSRIDPGGVTAASCTAGGWAQCGEGREGASGLTVWWWMVASQVGGAVGGGRSAHHWHMHVAQPCAFHPCNNLTNFPPLLLPFPPSSLLSPSWPPRNTETMRQGLIPSMCLKHASGESSPKTSHDLSTESVLTGYTSSTWSELERLREETGEWAITPSLHHTLHHCDIIIMTSYITSLWCHYYDIIYYIISQVSKWMQVVMKPEYNHHKSVTW